MDTEKAYKRYQAYHSAVMAGAVASCHDLSDGGLAVALAECSFGKEGLGAKVTLESDMSREHLLFHEGPSRILVSTVDPEAVEMIAARHNIPALVIGETQAGVLSIANRGVRLVDIPVGSLKQRWESALPAMLRGEHV